jgi:hypothetical protein
LLAALEEPGSEFARVKSEDVLDAGVLLEERSYVGSAEEIYTPLGI